MVGSELTVAVHRILADAHITIPYPQRDISSAPAASDPGTGRQSHQVAKIRNRRQYADQRIGCTHVQGKRHHQRATRQGFHGLGGDTIHRDRGLVLEASALVVR